MWNKTTQELDRIHRVLMRSNSTRNSSTTQEVEKEIERRVKDSIPV